MNTVFVRFSLLLLLLPFPPCWAVVATVDAVQMPAWLEHGNHVEPLMPGQQVSDGDKVRTGQGARAYIKLPEGSTVKLGESALLTYQSPQSAAQANSVFRAALNVATGAFRFTTATIRKLQKRDVAITVGNATIGIRGTDVWGRSGKDEDLVMLIEGHIEVRPAQGDSIALTEPLTVFTASKAGVANPLAAATPDELAARARETDIHAGNGALRKGGKVALILGSFDDEQQAVVLYDQLRAAGYGAKIKPKARGGESAGYRYEVALHGFASKAEADNAASRLKALTGLDPNPVR